MCDGHFLMASRKGWEGGGGGWVGWGGPFFAHIPSPLYPSWGYAADLKLELYTLVSKMKSTRGYSHVLHAAVVGSLPLVLGSTKLCSARLSNLRWLLVLVPLLPHVSHNGFTYADLLSTFISSGQFLYLEIDVVLFSEFQDSKAYVSRPSIFPNSLI